MNPVHPLRRISAFLFLSLFVYGVLVVPWPGVMQAYRTSFCAAGDILFESFGDASVSFHPIAAADHLKDTTVRIQKTSPPKVRGEFDMKSVYVGYRPTVFMIALIVATPLAWRRRLRALLWGLLWVNVFIAARVGVRLLDTLSRGDALSVFTISPFWKGLLSAVKLILYDAPASIYTVPAFIWLLVAFQRGDLHRILGSTPRTAHAKIKPTQ